MHPSPEIDPDAQWEYDDVQARGNYTQQVVVALAWADAVEASMIGSVHQLRRGAAFSRGTVFVAEQDLTHVNGRQVIGTAVVGRNSVSGRVEVLACDVLASPWWHGTSPELRAGHRLQ